MYPALTHHQQRNLPPLLKPAKAVAAQFEDSSHQLWFCETTVGPLFLKVADKTAIRASFFWQGVNRLFALNFPASLAETAEVQRFLSSLSPLVIPECLVSHHDFILCRQVAGSMLTAGNITQQNVLALAGHVAQLHQHISAQWGALLKPTFNAEQWSARLRQTLSHLASHHELDVPPIILGSALKQAADIQPDRLVPVMLDLRWDQFLNEDGQLSALVDLDAFVIAPRELELVLIELLLTQEQAQIFSDKYSESHTLPDLSEVRTAYRLLLFLMFVFGETDCQAWLDRPTYF